MVRVTIGYGIGMIALAGVSLVMIPTMVTTSGPEAWSSAAIGQAVGAIGATVIGYGWGLTGPAMIATQEPDRWRACYLESLRLKLSISLPVITTASLISAWTAPANLSFAVAGCISASMVGLSTEWFYVGINRPFWMFVLETLPRVLGGLAAIATMSLGWLGADRALLIQAAGVLAGVCISTFAIYRITSPWASRERGPRAPIFELLKRHRAGVVSQSMASFYNAAPIAVVGSLSPGSLPVFAVMDKALKQIITVMQPGVTAIQGLTPNADSSRRLKNVRESLLLSAAVSALLIALVVSVGGAFLAWLSAGMIEFSLGLVALLSINCGLLLFDSFLSRGILSAIGRSDTIARVTTVGVVLGLTSVAFLTPHFGAYGAVIGFGIGVSSRVLGHLFAIVTELRGASHSLVQ